MNTTQAAQAANMAAERTAYSLAREVLGLRAQLAELRETLANMEAEEGKEITTLEQEVHAANDIVDDLAIRLDLVRKALGVPSEPHQSLDERLLEAADRQAKLAALAEKFARARGRHHSQQAMCDLLEAFGLPCTRPGQEAPQRLKGYQPQGERRALANPPAAR